MRKFALAFILVGAMIWAPSSQGERINTNRSVENVLTIKRAKEMIHAGYAPGVDHGIKHCHRKSKSHITCWLWTWAEVNEEEEVAPGQWDETAPWEWYVFMTRADVGLKGVKWDVFIG